MRFILMYLLFISGGKAFAQASGNQLLIGKVDTAFSTVLNEHDSVRTIHVIGKRGMIVQNDHLGAVTLASCKGNFSFITNKIDTELVLSGKGSRGSVRFWGNEFTADLSRVDIQDWTLENIDFRDNFYKKLQMTFSRDTIRGSLVIDNMPPVGIFRNDGLDTCDRFELEFEDCYIDGAIDVGKNGKWSQIGFENCTFGPNITYIGLMEDYVILENCSNFPTSASLQMTANNDTCWLQLHSRLENADFIYGPDIHLAFNGRSPTDEYMSKYETLLAKFRNEGKKQSYQRLDIEYRQYKAARGMVWDQVSDWIQKEWWNYGYSRMRVVMWALLLFDVFWLLNSIWWGALQKVYPIPQEYPFIDKAAQPVRYQLQELLRTFLYTVYVFFSVKIDLSRLRVTNVWLLAYFLFQFLVGLGCLFFVINALLKIG